MSLKYLLPPRGDTVKMINGSTQDTLNPQEQAGRGMWCLTDDLRDKGCRYRRPIGRQLGEKRRQKKGNDGGEDGSEHMSLVCVG